MRRSLSVVKAPVGVSLVVVASIAEFEAAVGSAHISLVTWHNGDSPFQALNLTVSNAHTSADVASSLIAKNLAERWLKPH